MKLLEIWVATPLARALGWTLIHSLWEGALISGALALVLSLTRSARSRYAAACTALLAMLASVCVTFFRLLPEGIQGPSSAVPLAIPFWHLQAGMQSGTPANSGIAAAVPWLAPIWVIGVWVFVLAQMAGWISSLRLRQRGVCCAPERWQKELLRLRAQLRLSRPVQLLESCLADVPLVVGHLRPAILMPIGLLAGLPSGQVEAILLHELAHIRRHDYVVNILQRAVESLLFYNPAVWWISRVIRTERENCCDDVVVATRGNAQEYAIALTRIEKHRRPAAEAALAATGGNLMKRIHRLLYPKAPNTAWAPVLAAILLTTTAAAAFAAWPPQPLRNGFLQARTEATRQPEYQKWLNQDVVYIITPRERAEFEKLKTDAERNKFIEQFWERRNPHPGSAVNTFKEHYYHELAYANQHFGTKDTPGWKTDRGHMLILYGPPDEIDAHTDAKPYPYEEWMYRHIQGVGNKVTLTFIDRSGEGDYQLAPGPVNGRASSSLSAEPEKKDSRELRTPDLGDQGFKFVCSYCTAKEVPVRGEKGRTAFLVSPIKASPGDEKPPASQTSARPDSKDSTRPPESGKNGYSYPKCLDCPQAQYTREATAHKFQGTMTLSLVVTREGRANDIKVLKALPYGLTESAIETVKKWKFKPATGPDGKPAAVRQKIEISFHTY